MAGSSTVLDSTKPRKQPRNWSRQTKFKIRRTGLMKDPLERQAVTRARVHRVLKEQNAKLKAGTMESKLYTAGLEGVTRISHEASDTTAQIVERFLMHLLQDAGLAAEHAGRVTIKSSDLKLALRRLRK